MQRFRSMMERSGMKARFQNRRFENFVQDTQDDARHTPRQRSMPTTSSVCARLKTTATT